MKHPTKLRVLAALIPVALLPLAACGSGGKRSEALPEVITPEQALASERVGQYARSSELWARLLLDTDGQELAPYLGCGRSLLRLGEVLEACQVVERGMEVFPQNLDLYLLHGEILDESGFHRAAELRYEGAVELDQDSHLANLGLGRVRLELGLGHKALAPLRKARELEPGDQQTIRFLALAAEDSGYYAESFECRRELLTGERNPSAYRYVSAARLAFLPEVRQAHPDALEQARGWIDRAIELDPQDSEAHYLRARGLEQRGEDESAIAAYLRAIEVDPGNVAALSDLAGLYHATGAAEEADRFARMALELERDRRRRAQLETYLIESS